MNKADLDVLKARLPQYPDIQARNHYFNSAVLVSLVFQYNEWFMLFQKRANHIRQGGEICFPGGEYDSEHDDNSEATAIRETVEELGIVRQDITLVGKLDIVVSPQGVIVAPFVGVLDIQDIDTLPIDMNEVEEVFLLPVSYFEHTEPEQYHVRVVIQSSYIDKHGKEQILLPVHELGLPERYHSPWGGKNRPVLVYKTHGRTIWGLTAGIVHDFVQKLCGA